MALLIEVFVGRQLPIVIMWFGEDDHVLDNCNCSALPYCAVLWTYWLIDVEREEKYGLLRCTCGSCHPMLPWSWIEIV